MSNTKNKTEKVDTAPYLKKNGANSKDGRNENPSAKSNFVIPMVLLLVSAIVIVATFYEDEYNALLTSSDETTAVVETVETVEVIEVATSNKAETAGTLATTAPAAEAAATEALATKIDTPPAAIIPAPVTVATNNSNQQTQTKTVALTENRQAKKTQVEDNAQRPTGRVDRYNNYSREQAKARAKQHMAMIQERRQAYEKDMKERRTQYETAIKARQERRDNLVEAQKAAYQMAHKKHMETDQKLQTIYKKIDELHQEIEQIKREYYSNQRSSLAPMYTL